MGSFGWKSTDVTVPLWPGSCKHNVSLIRSDKQKELEEADLVQNLSAVNIPDTHHAVGASNSDAVSTIVLAPCTSQ
jgi:hypothetical protein